MADFPVSVSLNDITVDTATFQQLTPDSGIAIGDGWLLYQSGNTWTKRWCFVTERPIDDLVLNPFARPGKPKYAFDIIFTPTHSDEPDTGSAKGWAITDGKVKFKATYSNPVFVDGHPVVNNGNSRLLDLWESNVPHIHDMYGKLKIEFDEPLEGAVDLGENFIFRADTDCLPVEASEAKSYQNGQLTFALTMSKEGSGYIAERCGVDPTLVAGPFTVEDGEGTAEFSADLTLQPGCYYSVVNVADDGSMEAVPLEGVETNASNEYYHAE
jgi:hypothetical protein